MKVVRAMTMMLVVLGMNVDAGAMGWSKLKFWKKKDVACVDVCVEDCIDSCIDADCERDSCWSTLHQKLFVAPKHWLADVCRGTCCNVDIHSSCVESCVPDFCCDETCIGGDCVELCSTCDDNRRLARLIYTSQTACDPRDRKKAVHRIGSRFDCRCHPEVMCALIYALKDCNARVRAEAADEIGDQLRKSDCCCCSPEVIQALRCALNDESRSVRRESAQALRRCGIKVRRFSWLCRDSCLDGCVEDGCVDGCLDTCCVSSSCTTDSWVSAPEAAAPEVAAPAPKKEAPKPKAKKPVKLPQLKKVQPKKVEKKPVKKTPAPKPASKVKPKKDKYVPQDDATSFIMPNVDIQELLGAK